MTTPEEIIERANAALAAGDTASASELYEQSARLTFGTDDKRAAFLLKLASGYATNLERREQLALQAQGLLESAGDQDGVADVILVRATIAEEARDSLEARTRYTEAVRQLAFFLGETANNDLATDRFHHMTVTLETVIDKLTFCLNRLKNFER